MGENVLNFILAEQPIFHGNKMFYNRIFKCFTLKILRYEAKQFCESIGAQMLLIESAQEQKFMAQYFSEWQRAGVTRMWQRISDISTSYPKPSEQCDWTNGQSSGIHEPAVNRLTQSDP